MRRRRCTRDRRVTDAWRGGVVRRLAQRGKTGKSSMTTRSSTKALILMAEDDPAYGSAVADLLRSAGHVVRHVTDGDEAIRALRAEGHLLGLVLTDLLLPGKTGFQIAKEANDMGLGVPILAMTGLYDDLREIHSLRSLGVSGWIHKSAPFEHLLFRVNSLLWPSDRNDRMKSRVAVALPVQFRLDGRVHYATTYNLSTNGVYVRTPEPPVTGQELEVAVALPTAREMITVKAEVVHVATPEEVRGTAYPAGFGARFLQPSPLVAAALAAYLDKAIADEAVPVAEAREETEYTPKLEPVSSCC